MRLRWLVLAGLVVSGAGAASGAHARDARQAASVRQLMDGEQLYRSYCAACHGANAKGNGPAAPALKSAPADLTAIAKRNHGTFPRDRVAGYVENGDPSVAAHGSREMPVWGPNFVALAPGSYRPINERIAAVVSYIESIQIEN